MARSSSPGSHCRSVMSSPTPVAASAAGGGDERERERARLDAAEVDGDEPEAGGAHDSLDLLAGAGLGGPRDVLRRQLDPGHVAVVAHAAVDEPQSAQPRLRRLDLREL